MPELPEVETVMRGMDKQMRGKVLHRVAVHAPKLRWELPQSLSKLRNLQITSFTRRSKYVLMSLENGQTVLFHLGMSGKILFDKEKSYKKQKHNHAVFYFGDGDVCVFDDPRRFGMVDLLKAEEVEKSFYMKNLGPEPLSNCFTSDYLYNTLQKTGVPIKAAIMHSKVVVGVGNIYASESLFRAGISPLLPAKHIKRESVARLHQAILTTLEEAIAAGGSTLRDYVQADGSLGYFQHAFKVYGRAGEPCYTCSTLIKKVVQAQRSTYYCEKCQQK